MRKAIWMILVITLLLSISCTLTNLSGGENINEPVEPAPVEPTQAQPRTTTPVQATAAADLPAPSDPGALVQPSDLEYLGAFRLPESAEDEYSWKYSGESMTYYPNGDPNGPQDGYPGSLFAAGHDWNQYISEISIPVPVISPGKNLDDLNRAETLQGFQNIRAGLYSNEPFELPRTGLAYLPAQNGQSSDKLHFCWHQHMGEEDAYPSHGWSELDLSNPQSAGPWQVGEYRNFLTCDYLFEIPATWSQVNTPGMLLATGRFRDGGQGSMGPTLFAIGPWNQGNPPSPGTTIPAIPLLQYSSIYSEEGHTLTGYHHSDEWRGGAWLIAGDKAAVIFAGSKGQGENWYGCSDGTVWPDEPPYPPECPERGWWSTSFEHQIIFYNPDDLAAVARGELEPWAPQPYARLNLDPYLFDINEHIIFYDTGDIAFDRQRGLLFLIEPLTDDDKSIIHVWRVN